MNPTSNSLLAAIGYHAIVIGFPETFYYPWFVGSFKRKNYEISKTID